VSDVGAGLIHAVAVNSPIRRDAIRRGPEVISSDISLKDCASLALVLHTSGKLLMPDCGSTSRNLCSGSKIGAALHETNSSSTSSSRLGHVCIL